MQTQIVRQLGVERGDQDCTLAADHRSGHAVESGHAGQHFDVRAGPDHDWSPNEHRVQGVAEIGYLQLGFERVDLTAERVAPDADVDSAEAPLVGTPIDDVCGKKDHPGTGPERRHPVAKSFGQRIRQPGRLEQE